MKRSNLRGLVFGAAVLFFAGRPAAAQVWVRPTPPLMVAPAPVVVAPTTRVVVPATRVVTPAPVMVAPGWQRYPYWPGRRYRVARRRGWYAPAWGPAPVVYRRW